ncbi:MAG: N-acetylmuramic acid 6-phosphate etherase [Proteobacteria bacterium]|nr:N-acetylmuramic acid 6-phosphate etherase [Pseudomonadota bacterium]
MTPPTPLTPVTPLKPGTETPHGEHAELDRYPTDRLLRTLVDDQAQALAAVQAAAPQLARAVDAALPRINAGGRLVYVGAGTSGRLGLLDSVELNPTFSWPAERALALIAGGRGALFEAVEGAEDEREQGAIDIRLHELGSDDVALLLAASGSTPYVLGACEAARAAGALTLGFSNNPGAPLVQAAEIGIVLDTGPELVSGSTRLKAGTAQKIALNSFSTALMVRLHKVYGNLMVDLRATNAKLRRRALALTMRASGADELAAERALRDSGFRVKVAIVALRQNVSVHEAAARLQAHDGDLRAALAAAG